MFCYAPVYPGKRCCISLAPEKYSEWMCHTRGGVIYQIILIQNHQKTWIFIDFHRFSLILFWFSLIFVDFQGFSLSSGCHTLDMLLTPPWHCATRHLNRPREVNHAKHTLTGCQGCITKHPAVLKSWNYANIQIFMILPFFHTVFTTLKRKQNYIYIYI